MEPAVRFSVPASVADPATLPVRVAGDRARTSPRKRDDLEARSMSALLAGEIGSRHQRSCALPAETQEALLCRR